jgi:hypothetical protein
MLHLQPDVDSLIALVISQEKKHAGEQLKLISQDQLRALNYTGLQVYCILTVLCYCYSL